LETAVLKAESGWKIAVVMLRADARMAQRRNTAVEKIIRPIGCMAD